MTKITTFTIKALTILLSCLLMGIMNPLPAFAQAQNFTSYCQSVASLPSPPDGPNPNFTEPKYDDLKRDDNRDSKGKNWQGSGNVTISGGVFPFAKNIADWLEGSYQDEQHRLADLRQLTAVQFQSYNGPAVELLTQAQQDILRVNYVREIMAAIDANNNTKLAEATFDFADVCGKNPRSVKDLVLAFGMPQPPTQGGDRIKWLQSWQRYWPKIPLSTNPLSQGCITFYKPVFPNLENDVVPSANKNCPVEDSVRIGVPDVHRLNNLSTILQNLLVSQQLMGQGTYLPDIDQTANQQAGGSPLKIYDASGNVANQVTISPSSEKTRVAGVFPTLWPIWKKLIGYGPEVFAGALPGLATKQDLVPAKIEQDAQVSISASENLPIYARFLGGVGNLVASIKKSVFPQGAR